MVSANISCQIDPRTEIEHGRYRLVAGSLWCLGLLHVSLSVFFVVYKANNIRHRSFIIKLFKWYKCLLFHSFKNLIHNFIGKREQKIWNSTDVDQPSYCTCIQCNPACIRLKTKGKWWHEHTNPASDLACVMVLFTPTSRLAHFYNISVQTWVIYYKNIKNIFNDTVTVSVRSWVFKSAPTVLPGGMLEGLSTRGWLWESLSTARLPPTVTLPLSCKWNILQHCGKHHSSE